MAKGTWSIYKEERLRLTVVRGINRKRPFSYRVIIGANPLTGSFRTGVRYMMMYRLHTMGASTDMNLNNFLASFRKFGVYALGQPLMRCGNSPIAMVRALCNALDY